MRGKKFEPELKSRIIAESLKAGCVITELGKQYGISADTIYGWRNKYIYNNNLASSSVTSEAGVEASSEDGRFIELTVSKSGALPNLQEASLKFDNFSLLLLTNSFHQGLYLNHAEA